MKSDRRFYHGGYPKLFPGDYVLPPNQTNAASCSEFGGESVHRKNKVYVTTSMNAALLFAAFYPRSPRGMVYEVVPLGDVEPDPDCSHDGLSFQCDSAQVVRVIHHVTKKEQARIVGALK